MYICGIVTVQEIQGDGMPTQIFRRARVYGCACMHKMFKNFKPPIYFLKWSNLNEIHFTKAKISPEVLKVHIYFDKRDNFRKNAFVDFVTLRIF